MGARKDGIYEVEDTGGGAAVSITSPIGQQPMAGSVSVVIASDQTALSVTFSGNVSVVNIERTVTGTLTNVNDSLTLDVTGLGTLVGYATTNDITNTYGILGSVDGVNYFYNVGPFYTPTATSYLAKTSPLSLATADFAAVGIVPQFKVDVAGLVSIKFVRTIGSGSAQTWVLGASVGPLPSNNFFLTGSAGHTAAVDVNGAVSITALALPLPTGAATELTLQDIDLHLFSIDSILQNNGAAIIVRDVAVLVEDNVIITNNAADLVAGQHNATQPIYDDGDAANFQMSSRGGLRVIPSVEGFPVSAVVINTIGVTIGDGTTSPVAVKPAATAAAIADKALVVAISPNNTVPENLTQIAGAAVSLGQKTSALSFPVVLASDQSAVPISGSISITSSSLATATALNPSYTEGAASALSQDLTGNLRTKVSALVSENRQLYDDAATQPLSLNRSGRLRIVDESDDNQKLIMLNTKIYSVLLLILNTLDSKSNYDHSDIDSDPSILMH